MKQWRVNDRIRISQVRVIGDDGTQLGVMATSDALRQAREQGCDLVEVSPTTSPPVCRIMDFNKFRYAEQRREREAKKKHHVVRLKEVKFKPRIGEHDYQVKLRNLKKFLMQGDQAKVTMVYRGREMAHTELGRRILDRLIGDLKFVSRVERTPSLEGRFMTMIFGADREKIKQAEREASRQRQQTERAPSASAAAAPAAGSSGSSGSSAQPSSQKGAQ